MKKCFETGVPSIKEKSGSDEEACFRTCKYWRSAAQGQIVGVFRFGDSRKVVMLVLECLKCGRSTSINTVELIRPGWKYVGGGGNVGLNREFW